MGNTTSLTDEYPARDIINLIVDITDVREFHKLRRVSKLLQSRVDETMYGGYYRKFIENEGDSMRMILNYYSRYPDVSLTMADFFDELKKPKCECGNYAWQVDIFSFPPRRICYWGDSVTGMHSPCFSQLVKLNHEGLNIGIPDLAKLFNIPEEDLECLPIIPPYPRPSDLTLMDLKTIEWIASKKNGDSFTKSATEKLKRDFPEIIETTGWGTSFVPPVTVGIYDPPPQGEQDGEVTTTLSQLLCCHCYSSHPTGTAIVPHPVSQQGAVHSVYPYVPHDYRHLREHISVYHQKLLEDFEAGWNELPISARKSWSTLGNYPSSSLCKTKEVFPQFDCWSNSFRAMWVQQTQRMEQTLIHLRARWVLEYGHLNTWRTRDIQVDVPNYATDMSLALNGFYLMKEYNAIHEFGERWRDDRDGLWREICVFWHVADVLPHPPEIPTE